MQPIKSQYETCNKKFAQFLEIVDRRKATDEKKALLDEQKKEKMTRLVQMSDQMTKLQFKQNDITVLQKQIEKKQEERKKRTADLEKYRRICDDKVGVIQHHMKILQAFKRKFREDYEACQAKYRETDVLEFLLMSRQRVLMLELCTIFFGEKGMHLFTGIRHLNKIAKDFLDILGKEDEVSMTLGYLVLVLNLLAKYSSVPLKFGMQFLGSRSIIMKNSAENYPLHISKVYDRNKFEMALMHLIGNFQQIFEYFSVDRKFKKTNFKVLFTCLVNLLYDGSVR